MAGARWTPAVATRYVIDASVGGAASRPRPVEPETSRRCRKFMLVVKTYGYYVALTDDIRLEWRHRASRWSEEWLLQMMRSGRVRWVVPDDCSEIEEAISASGFSTLEEVALRKDLRLVAAALPTSRVIVSMDVTAIELFTSLADGGVVQLQAIRWIDPMSGELPPHPH